MWVRSDAECGLLLQVSELEHAKKEKHAAPHAKEE